MKILLLGKPFAMILNSADPGSESAIALAYELEAKYGVPVALVSCLDLDAEDIRKILEMVLHEFPVAEIHVSTPEWLSAIEPTHRIRASLLGSIRECADKVTKIGDVREAFAALSDNEYVRSSAAENIDLGTGKAEFSVAMNDGLYYEVISELTGFDIEGEESLISLLCDLAAMKNDYERVSDALIDVNEKGYGIVMPDKGALKLEEPVIVKQAGGYGVRLRASAQSIHMIRANIETEISPIVGTEQQSEELIKYILREFEEDPSRIWESNMFGKSLYELVGEGVHSKLEHMPDDARLKLSETLERIVNEGSSGLICILL